MPEQSRIGRGLQGGGGGGGPGFLVAQHGRPRFRERLEGLREVHQGAFQVRRVPEHSPQALNGPQQTLPVRRQRAEVAARAVPHLGIMVVVVAKQSKAVKKACA